MSDEEYMRLAIKLAKQAEGNTSPNPMVGAVIVSPNGEIIAQGYHQKAGQPHAEINALKASKGRAHGATMYVSLEPCAHTGRTGPCCDAIIRAGIKKVIFAVNDPNPLVAGEGERRLIAAGLEVIKGICAQEATELNEKFFNWITNKRPFVSIKYAMTLDGKIATVGGDSKWITGEEARTYAHELRNAHDAILVGVNTVLADDPQLTTRMVKGKNPVRLVLDANARIPLHASALNGEAETIIIVSNKADPFKLQLLRQLPKVSVLELPLLATGFNLQSLMEELSKRQLTSLLIEGGAATHGMFLDAGLVDRVYAFIAPKVLGGANSIAAISGNGKQFVADAFTLHNTRFVQLGKDYLITGSIER